MMRYLFVLAASIFLTGCTATPKPYYSASVSAPASQDVYDWYTACRLRQIEPETPAFDACMDQMARAEGWSRFGSGATRAITSTTSVPTALYSGRSVSTPSRATSRRYITGPRGGCYYINSNGNKTYVDHSYCY